MSNYENKTSGTISIEVTILKKTWCKLFAYRSPQNSNKTLFFEEIANSLNKWQINTMCSSDGVP